MNAAFSCPASLLGPDGSPGRFFGGAISAGVGEGAPKTLRSPGEMPGDWGDILVIRTADNGSLCSGSINTRDKEFIVYSAHQKERERILKGACRRFFPAKDR
jgi:hypothetical protein